VDHSTISWWASCFLECQIIFGDDTKVAICWWHWMTHWWLLSTVCWKKTDTKVRKLQMKQTYQHLFSGFWPKLCVRDKSLPGWSHTSWQKNTKQLARGFHRNSAATAPQPFVDFDLDRTVALGETWIQGFEPELNHHSSHWKLLTCPCPNKCSC
jgi:hypothetical protein